MSRNFTNCNMKFGHFLPIFVFALVCLYANTVPGVGAKKLKEFSALSQNEQTIAHELSQQLADKLSPHRDDMAKWVRNMIYDVEAEPMSDYINCDICLPALTIIRPLLSLFPDTSLIVWAVIFLCQLLNLAPTPEICAPTVHNFADSLLFIAKNKTQAELSNTDFCGIINPGCHPISPRFIDWPIAIAPNKPEVANPAPIPATERGIKILQFTDLHVDLDYEEGAPSECDSPTCCRRDTISTGNEVAGPYGSFKCALPRKALEAIYSHAAATNEDVQYIFLTGDYIHSAIWLYNEAENVRHIREVTTKLKAAFPRAKIFPITGNHEAAPCNQYPPPAIWQANGGQFDLEWMYRATIEDFPELFATAPEQKQNFMYGGYYTLKPEPGASLRLVILNSNLCYTENFWLAYDPIDPAGQLQWFADTMRDAEAANEYVYILAHIIPGSRSCWDVWSERYDQIVNRFENIVKGQFYGHSHKDHYSLSFERGTHRPTSAHFVAPSMVTDGMPSAYRVYYADGNRGDQSTWEILNYETHILDTYKSNEANRPVFEHLYSAREAFGLESLRPQALFDLTVRMISDYPLYQKYEKFYYKNTTAGRRQCGPPQEDPDCIVNSLCSTVRAYSGDNSHCGRLGEIMDEFLTQTTTTTTTPGASSTLSFGQALLSTCVVLSLVLQFGLTKF